VIGDAIDPARLAAALGLVAAYALWAGGVARRVRRGRAAVANRHDALLVVHASQTGTAESVAQATAAQLQAAGHEIRLIGLGDVHAADLTAHRWALFVASTCREGDAPDDAQRFQRAVMEAASPPALDGLRIGVLGLGDRRFAHYCGFARQLDDWLQVRGAEPLFERVEVDALASHDLQRWQDALGPLLAGAAPAPLAIELPAAPATPWTLLERRELNPGSVGEPVFHLEWVPADGGALPAWEAGDLVRLTIPGDAAPRDYSIASVPADGRLHLVVRRSRRADGSIGAASGWLARMPPGTPVAMQLVAHRSFRLGANAERPLILIGNGTGIAGLRAHLRARAGRPRLRHWLLFGERQRAIDFHFRAELEAWQAAGMIERADFAFSRDGAERIYVQDLLAAQPGPLRAWVADGAAIYVCGSLVGMGEGVDAALRAVLGDGVTEDLQREGRYRRDVY
jgi:sulfite reductase (NADPH) flavoprotein alpha-component